MAEAGRALVTGGARRIGRAIAEALGAAGWEVAVHYRSSAHEADDVVRAIKAAGGRAAAIRADLANEAETAGLVADAQAALGAHPTLLVNSASTFENDTATGHRRIDWDHHMEANLRAPVLLAQRFANALPSAEKGGIINLIDQRVWKLTPQFFTYTLSKSALWTATQTLAQALAPRIRVNAVAPGPTLRSVHQNEADFAAECAATLTGEGSNPDEIVRAVLYLVAAESVTGQMIASDGGQHLNWQTPDTQI
ncbi:MAG: SDR family oxidoreductase [Alphaproteobacteria bacterium]|jgi:NAD(P)-dependent dehydrogenase (short-subunit alcohol dehydrogenase family)|nr:SDR family oxidoreductase [Alphaproteobacteria bacterium]